MPNLREALKQTSGTDVGGNEFTLQETDIQPYIDNPEMAQMQADVTQARYGGTTIQDDRAAAGGAPIQSAGADQGRPKVDVSRRGEFEQYVFNQLKSDSMPDGNPFTFNPTASMNAISKSDLPELFSTVFQNQVTWEDRHLLDDDQKKYWMAEVKAFRAHLKGALDAEKQEAVGGYNQMMNGFDNAVKENEVARKQKRQRRQDITKAKDEKRKRGDKRQETYQANMKRKSELLTDLREITQTVMEAATSGVQLTDQETNAYMKEAQSKRDELRAVATEISSYELPKPKSGVSKVAASKEKPKGAKPSGKEIGETFDREMEKQDKSPMVVRGKVPKQGTKKTVAKSRIIKKGPNKGRKVLKYTDGTTAYADETK